MEEIIVDRAFSGRQGIDEDEVETMPETLIPYRNILLDDKLQKEAKKYFTDDGWLAAQNTIDILKNFQTSGNMPLCTLYLMPHARTCHQRFRSPTVITLSISICACNNTFFCSIHLSKNCFNAITQIFLGTLTFIPRWRIKKGGYLGQQWGYSTRWENSTFFNYTSIIAYIYCVRTLSIGLILQVSNTPTHSPGFQF